MSREGFCKNFCKKVRQNLANSQKGVIFATLWENTRHIGIGLWCNGSTTGFGSVCLGSNPGKPTTRTARKLRAVFVLSHPATLYRAQPQEALRPEAPPHPAWYRRKEGVAE